MKKLTAFITTAVLALSMLPVMAVSAATDPYSVTRDTYITKGNDTDHHDMSKYEFYNMQISKDGTWDNVGIIEFDLSAVAAEEVINKAVLQVQIKQNALTADNTLLAYAMADEVWVNDTQVGLTGNNTYDKIGEPIAGAAAAVAVGQTGTLELDVTPYIQKQLERGVKKPNIAVCFEKSSSGLFMLKPKEDGGQTKITITSIKPPAVQMLPLQDMYYMADEVISVQANVTLGDNSLATMEFLVDGKGLGVQLPESGTVTKEITGLAPGRHTIAVRVTDNEEISAESGTVAVYVADAGVVLTDGQKNQADLTYVTKGNGKKPDNPYNSFIKNQNEKDQCQYTYVKFDFNEITDSVISAKMRITVKGVELAQPIEAYEVADNSWSYNETVGVNSPDFGAAIPNSRVEVTANGVYYLDVTDYIKAKQQAGETMASIGIFAPNTTNKYIMIGGKGAEGITLHYVATKGPVITNLTPADGTRVDPDSPVVISARVTDEDNNLDTVKFYIDGEETSPAAETDGVYTVDAGMLSIGRHMVTVRAEDRMGAAAAAQAEIHVALPLTISQSFTGTLTKNTPVASVFTMTNQDSRQAEGVAVVGLYSAENKLLAVDFERFALKSGGQPEEISVGFTLPDMELTGCTVKSFVWDGFELQQPISEIYTME